MKTISFDSVKAAVCEMCGKAACDLPADVLNALKSAAKNACDAIKLIVGEKIDMAMNKFNS